MFKISNLGLLMSKVEVETINISLKGQDNGKYCSTPYLDLDARIGGRCIFLYRITHIPAINVFKDGNLIKVVALPVI